MPLEFGSDPEFVVVDNNGVPVSAIKALKGHGKDDKLQIGTGTSVFYDNVLLEMNLPPARTLLEFMTSFRECLFGTLEYFKSKGKSYNLVAVASTDFPLTEVNDIEAGMFGCKPEYCIYSKTSDGKIRRVDPPVMMEGSTFRSCGGHIHIGHAAANVERNGKPADVIKLMDGLVGIVSILIDTDPSSLPRRKLYGGAGSHRLTSYGVEYRTPSNFWLSNVNYTGIIYQLTRKVVELALTNPSFIDNVVDEKSLQNIINTSDEKNALQVYKDYAAQLPYELQKDIEKNFKGMTKRNHLLGSWYDVKTLAA